MEIQMWNYWKCRVYKYSKHRWAAVVIETDVIVVLAGTFARAVKQAIKFQVIQHRTHGKGWGMQKHLIAVNKKLEKKLKENEYERSKANPEVPGSQET